MDEAMAYIQKDVSILLEPEITERITRKILTNDDINRVKILRNPKVKVPGSHAVPYTASIMTILVLSYKYVDKNFQWLPLTAESVAQMMIYFSV